MHIIESDENSSQLAEVQCINGHKHYKFLSRVAFTMSNISAKNYVSSLNYSIRKSKVSKQKTIYRHWMTVYGRVRFRSKTRETLKRLKFQRQPERLKSSKVIDSQCWGLSFFYFLTWWVTLCRVYLFPFKMCQVSKL